MRYLFLLFILLNLFLVNAVNVDENVLNELENNPEVEVIISFPVKSRFLQKDFDANSVIGNLDKKEFEGEYFKNSNIASGKLNKNGLERLKKNKNVDGIYLDYKVKINLNESVKLVNSSLVNTLRVRGSFNLTGKNIGVCVLDTGVNYSLSYLGGGLGKKILTGYDYVNSDTDPMDDNGHGTHVAGIIASNGSLIGIAPEANIIALKVLDSGGGGSVSDVINGIQWCIDNSTFYNISVITMSLSCGTFDSACDSSITCNSNLLKAVVNEAVGKNISVIASTGNNGDGTMSSGNFTHIGAPACLSNITAVGAINDDFNIASYGNRNNLTWLMAPGTNIKSLRYNNNVCSTSCTCSGDFMTCSGTSMSAPHVAAAYAILLQYLRDENNSIMKNNQLKYVLNITGINVLDSTTNLNYRTIDIFKALLQLDNFGPDVKIDYPQNITYKTGNLTFNFSATDVTFNSSWYILNGNEKISLNKNTTLSVDNGSHILILYANDTEGNLNSTSISFAVNTSLPILTFNSPNDNFIDNDGLINFNCSAISSVGLKNMSLLHNISGTFKINQTKDISGENNYSIFSFNSSNIKFNWTCLVSDINSGYAFGDNRSLTVNVNNKPNITSYLPENLTQNADEGKNLSFNHTSSDLDNDVLSYNWILNDIEKSISQNYTFSPNYTESGSYNLSLVVGDSKHNTSINWSVAVNDIILCGNNIKESGEDCDGTDLSGEKCSSKGFSGGTLSCSSSCKFVTNSCTSTSSGGSGGSSGGGSASGGGGTSLSEFDNPELFETTKKEKAQIQAAETPVKVIVEKPNLDSEEKIISIIKGENIGFILDNNEHKVTLDETRENEIDLTINSKTVKLTLRLNEEKEADIDDDKWNDIRIKLEKVLEGEATLKITKIQEAEKKGAKGITGFSAFSAYKDSITSYGAGISGLLFILIFVFYMFKRKRRG